MDYINEILVECCFLWAVLFIIDIAYFVIRLTKGDLSRKNYLSNEANDMQIIDKELNSDGISQRMDESAEVILDKQNKELRVY